MALSFNLFFGSLVFCSFCVSFFLFFSSLVIVLLSFVSMFLIIILRALIFEVLFDLFRLYVLLS